MYCRNAIEQFGGDEVEALLAFVESEEYCTEKKACALWALGQLGAEKALPFLQENYENPVNKNLCVYEAQFAIQKISEKRFNLPGFLWRGFF